jgi:hypothetical protein
MAPLDDLQFLVAMPAPALADLRNLRRDAPLPEVLLPAPDFDFVMLGPSSSR